MEKMVSAGKTWWGDGRFPLQTLITICSFPDNNTGKMHKPPLKWKNFPSPSCFCSVQDDRLLHRRHAMALPISASVIIGRRVCRISCIAERRRRRAWRANSPTFVSLSFSPPGRICILMEGFYRLLGGVRGTTSGIIK